METRDGLIEFRLTEVEVPHRGRVRVKMILQYRQCFKGMWTPWTEVPNHTD
jgi:hypothetical protein